MTTKSGLPGLRSLRGTTAVVGQGIAGSVVAWTLDFAGSNLLLIDPQAGNSASVAAAGLMTPFTGKRLAQTPDYLAVWNSAREFYSKVEAVTGVGLLSELPMLRLFDTIEKRNAFIAETETKCELLEWNGSLQEGGNEKFGVRVVEAGRLNVKAFLAATAAYFEDRFIKARLHPDDIQPVDVGFLLKPLDRVVERVVFCQGHEQTEAFPRVPDNPARGDILTVRIPGWTCKDVVHRSIWVAPNDNGTQTVGSTYDWLDLSPEPSEIGRRDLLEKLERIADGPFEVLDHVAGVRPTMRDYKPVIGQHPEKSGLFVFNGLGSKGTIRAPRLAAQLLDLVADGTPPPAEIDFLRLWKPPGRKPLTQVAQEAVAEVLQPEDTAIDATVGNGFDTCFLAEIVGPAGQVVGYDIQAAAIESTRLRLQANGLTNVELRLESHANLAAMSSAIQPAVVMFNLGYLPKGDHAVITEPESSCTAVAASIELLAPGGLLSVLCYRGHSGGAEEFKAVAELFAAAADRHEVQTVHSTPPRDTSPVLLLLKKRADKNDVANS